LIDLKRENFTVVKVSAYTKEEAILKMHKQIQEQILKTDQFKE
jgi:hypothetical protein